MYLVVSGHDDTAIPFVERHLDEPFVLINTRDILQGKTFSYSIRSGKTTILWNGQAVKDVRSVWYRRLLLIQPFELPVPEGQQKYARDALWFFNRLVFAQFPKALWVSDFYAVERADDKFWQLQVAARLGLNVADTLFTASSEEAKAFVRTHKKVIAKPNYSALFQKNGESYTFYTSRVDKHTDFSGLHLAPAILQEAIDVKTELRITVVGDQVFAASVKDDLAGTAKHIRDWRAATRHKKVTYKAFDLPQAIRNKCVALVKELGLQFGAIDIILDTRGTYWFLENNPNGQWSFIEESTGLPIGAAIAHLLMQGKK